MDKVKLYQLADDFVEAMLMQQFSRKQAYIDAAMEVYPGSRVAIFPPRVSTLSKEEISQLRRIANKVPAADKEPFIAMAADIFRHGSSYGLISVLTFKDLIMNGQHMRQHTVFAIDGLVLDINYNIVSLPIREYFQLLYKENDRLFMDKNKSIYYPNMQLGYYINLQQWLRLTTDLGLDYDEAYFYNNRWKAQYTYGPQTRRRSNAR